MAISFNLGTYAKFEKYEAMMQKQLTNLKTELALKEEQIVDLEKQYITKFTAGENPVQVSGKISETKTVIAMLENEIELIESSDITEKELSKQVYDEYQEFLKNFGTEQNRLWDEAVSTLQAAHNRVMELNKEYNELHDKASRLTNDQLIPVIDHLPFAPNIREDMKRRVWIMQGTPLSRVKDIVH